MAKIKHEELIKEVEQKGFKLIDDSQYQNMKSTITVMCDKGHEIDTNLETFRKISFVCPICDGVKNVYIPTNKLPEKNGYRVVAFDQATERMGVSVFDSGKLVYYDLYTFTGDVVTRLCKIRSLIEDTIIPRWKPDFVMFEDIQYQNNIMTFKVLAMLLGICETVTRHAGVEYGVVLPKVWRSGIGYSGRNRAEEKALAKKTVKEMFGVVSNEDTCEAILIGKYATKFHQSKRAF